jgi:hypothetical protein
MSALSTIPDTYTAVWILGIIVLLIWFAPLEIVELVMIGVLIGISAVAITQGPSLELIAAGFMIVIAAAPRAAIVLGGLLADAVPHNNANANTGNTGNGNDGGGGGPPEPLLPPPPAAGGPMGPAQTGNENHPFWEEAHPDNHQNTNGPGRDTDTADLQRYIEENL